MHTIYKAKLLQELKTSVIDITDKANQLLGHPHGILDSPPAPGSWSIVEVIEHLNTYNDYYLPFINMTFIKATPLSAPQMTFKPGRLGNYFVRLMQLKNGKIKKKMKAAKKHLPKKQSDPTSVINAFIQGQKQLLNLIEQSSKYDIQKLSTPISILPLIRLRIGDSFRFLTVHQERHFCQIERNIQILSRKEENLLSTPISPS
ncbi:DinB family protein [Pedobacter sp. JY14-1]|uniref:DinB family protein n=1 Tax=Pedobacter sp. JY14-1 TaxID=3034151 RepID=UPI0023E2903B|nr:DinB family protein [Pedobacter sp. JY14-1]